MNRRFYEHRRRWLRVKRFVCGRGPRQPLRKAEKMIHKAIFFRVALVLTLVNACAPANLMAGIPLRCEKEHCPCESPVCARPDDYCDKPIPCAPCLPGCSRCDDHCRKGVPCIPCRPLEHRCNDYCRKCLPQLCPTRMIRPGCASSCGEGGGCGSAGTSSSNR